MLSIEVTTFVKSFPIWNPISADVLENYCLCCLIYSLAQLRLYTANNRADWIVLLIVSNGKTTDNILCIGRVCVTFGRVASVEVVFKAVSTIEELTDVASYVMLKDESTSWVAIDELLDVQHHLIEDYQLLPLADRLIKLTLAHGSLWDDIFDFFAKLELVQDLIDDQGDSEKS